MATSILSGISDELESLVELARSRVVCVGTGRATPRSGLIIGDGEVLTVAKAADRGENVPVHLGKTEYMATVVGFDAASGIALLSHPELKASALVASEVPAVGSLGLTVACPIPGGHEARLGLTRCAGGETRLAGGRRIAAYFQTDSARFRGFAGAVVFGPSGEVQGMSMPVHHREEGFVIPTTQLIEIATQLREGKSLGTGYLGISATPADLPSQIAGHKTGLLITSVESGSPAKNAGLQVGNFVVKVADSPTPDLESLYDTLVGVSEGTELPVSLVRSSGEMEVVIVKVSVRQ